MTRAEIALWLWANQSIFKTDRVTDELLDALCDLREIIIKRENARPTESPSLSQVDNSTDSGPAASLRDVLSVRVKEHEIGDLLQYLNGVEWAQMIVRRMAFQRRGD